MWDLLQNGFIHKIEFPRFFSTDTLVHTVFPYFMAINAAINKKLDANFLFGHDHVSEMLKRYFYKKFFYHKKFLY